MSIQIVRDIIANQILKSMGASYEHKADFIADRCVESMSEEFRGTYVYVPASIVNKEERNKQIKEEFDGKNIRQLSRKHKLSAMRIYQIINDKSENNK